MKILVTGTSGFVGSYVARCFAEYGAEVHVVVRREHSLPEVLRDRVEVCVADLTARLGEFGSCDVIVHAAGANDVQSQDPEAALRITAWTARNLLQVCSLQRQRVPYFSTFQVYGRWSGVISEETAVECENDYALTHFLCRTIPAYV